MIKEFRIRVTGKESEIKLAETIAKDAADTIRFHIDSVSGDVEFYTSEIAEHTGFLYGLESIETLNEKVVNKV